MTVGADRRAGSADGGQALRRVIRLAGLALSRIECDLKDIRLKASADFSDPRTSMWRLKEICGNSADLVTRWIRVPALEEPALLAYFSNLVDMERLESAVLKPLLEASTHPARWTGEVLGNAAVEGEKSWDRLLPDLAAGKVAIFARGLGMALVADVAHIPSAPIGKPETERQVRGPDEAFSSVQETQIAQLRSRIREAALRVERFTVGVRQHTSVALIHLDGLTNGALVASARTRIRQVSVDALYSSTALAGIIRDHPMSIFPTVRATERVVTAVEQLYEGRVLILVDRDPFVLVAPAALADFYRTSMDYTSSWVDTSFVRMIRLAGWVMGIYLPAFYIAAAVVHPNVVPFSFQVLMIGSQTGMPFPPVVEAFMLIFVIEVLREAALRLPSTLSMTIGTVGAIVVGTAVVKAGLVSPQLIVIITLTALSLFTVPVYELTGSWRVVNFAMMTMSSMFGFWGITMVTFVFIGIFCGMESFGAPYFAPWAPFRLRDWNDLLVRAPWSLLRTRLTAARPDDVRRMVHRHVRAIPVLRPARRPRP